jgi:hypothetical protein
VGHPDGCERVSPDGSGDSRSGAAVLVGWTACAGGGACTGGALSGEGDGLDSAGRATDCTVLTQTAGFGLRANAVAASISTATAPTAASASFRLVIGR